MKKNVLKMMALTFVLSLSLVFTACGSGDNKGSDSVRQEENTNDADSAGQKNDVDPAGQKNDADPAEEEKDTNDAGSAQEESGSGLTALDEYLASPAGQSEIDSLSDMFKDQFKIEVYSENGNILVYKYTYTESFLEEMGLDLSDDAVRDLAITTLKEQLDTQSSTFESMRDTLRSSLGMSDLSVRVIYCGSDGSELVSTDF